MLINYKQSNKFLVCVSENIATLGESAISRTNYFNPLHPAVHKNNAIAIAIAIEWRHTQGQRRHSKGQWHRTTQCSLFFCTNIPNI